MHGRSPNSRFTVRAAPKTHSPSSPPAPAHAEGADQVIAGPSIPNINRKTRATAITGAEGYHKGKM